MATKPTYEELEQLVKKLEKENSERKQTDEVLYRENILRSFTNGLSEHINFFNSELICVDVNKTALKRFGVKRESVIGKSLFELVPDVKETGRYDEYMKVLKTGEPFYTEEVIPQKKYDIKKLYLSVKAFKVGDGFAISTIDVTEKKLAEEALKKAHDELEERVKERTEDLATANKQLMQEIQDRKQLEESLRENEERLRMITENTEDIFWLCENGKPIKVLYISPAYEKFSAHKIDVVDTDLNKWLENVYEGDRERGIYEFQKFLECKGKFDIEWRLPLPDGTFKWMWLKQIAISTKKGRVHKFVGIARDITERKQLEESLRESEKSLIEAQAIAYIGSWRWETIPDKVYWSDETYRLFGWEPGEDVDYDKYLETVFPDDLDFVKKEINDALDDVKSFENEHRIIRNGEVRTHHTRGKVFRDEQGKPTKMVGVVQDITERKRAEESLKKSEEKFKTLFELAPDAYYLYDLEGNFIDGNKAAEELIGFKKEELIGKHILQADILSIDQIPKAKKTLEKSFQLQPIKFGELVLHRKDNLNIFLEACSTPINLDGKDVVLGIARDVTRRKLLEEDLRQSQKMEAIGTLAGGIAHDFNNILSIILGNTELAMDDVPEWNPALNNLEEVKTASLRAKDVVKQLLSFSRKETPKQKPVNISPIINDCLKFLRSSIPTSIDIHKNIPDVSSIISADPTQMHQVMLNLCTNAAQAMSENDGTMEVSLSVVEIDKDKTNQDIGLNQGQYVKVTVSDTGHGIAKEHLDRIFDPYFTTRKVGEGSGIGLSVVHGIVKSHNGAISVDSEYGKGTTFNVFLPVVKNEPAFEEETDTTILTGTERILFVDDEKSIANMTSQMLERIGYTVTAKTSSKDTLEAFRTRPGNFDLIISDMSMPEITGDKLAKELQQIRPEIPIILCTGHSEKIDDEKAKSIGVKALVMKPIVKSVLAKTIRKVLD